MTDIMLTKMYSTDAQNKKCIEFLNKSLQDMDISRRFKLSKDILYLTNPDGFSEENIREYALGVGFSVLARLIEIYTRRGTTMTIIEQMEREAIISGYIINYLSDYDRLAIVFHPDWIENGQFEYFHNGVVITRERANELAPGYPENN